MVSLSGKEIDFSTGRRRAFGAMRFGRVPTMKERK